MEQGLRLNVRNETVVIVILIIQDICFILGISHNFWNNLLFPKIIFYIKLRETPSIFLDSLKLPKKNSMQKKCAKVSIYLIKYIINVYKITKKNYHHISQNIQLYCFNNNRKSGQKFLLKIFEKNFTRHLLSIYVLPIQN